MNYSKYLVEYFGTLVFLFIIIATGNPWMIGLTLAILIALGGAISGGNFNPAVSVIMYYIGNLSLMDMISYIILQILGGLSAVEIYRMMTIVS